MDSAGIQDSVDLRDIEEDMFRKTKVDVVNATGPWIGSSEQNKMADLKISTFVRNSFKTYEKSRPIGEKSYFKFWASHLRSGLYVKFKWLFQLFE